MKSRRFSNSFRRVFDELEPGELCNLKHHYRGALREVIGLLDLWASNDPERFVELYGGVDAIVTRCHRFKRPEDKFSKPMIEKVLKELRSRHIISKRLVRVRDGEEVEGFIVAPHDCLAVRESPTKCVFKGQLQAPGRWRRDPVLDEKGEWGGKLGPVYWAGFSSGTARSTVESTVQSTANCTVGTSPQRTENETLKAENRALTVITESAVLTKEKTLTHLTDVSGQESRNEKGKSNTNPNCKTGKGKPGVVLSNKTDQKLETIADHFSEWPDNYRGVIVAVSTGLISDEIGKSDISAVANGLRFYNWPELAKCCRAVVVQQGGAPYLGRKTHGDVMAWAMGLFKERHGINTPACWYAVAKKLRESGTEKIFVSEDDGFDEWRRHQDEIVAEEMARLKKP